MIHYMQPPIQDIAEPLSDGTWVNSKIARIVEIIREQFPDLEVTWIPRDKRNDGDAAFAIVEVQKDGRHVVAFYVQNEADFDESVLERIIRADMSKKDPQKVEAEITAKNEAVRLIAEKKQKERVAELMEPYMAALKSGKHKYTGPDGKRLYYDY